MPRIVLTQNGNLEFVYSDRLKGLLGPVASFSPETTQRASTVELEGDVWVSRLLDGTELCRGPQRGPVVEEEHRLIEEMLVRGEKIPGIDSEPA